MAKNIISKVLMITGAGAQEFDSDEFNSAVETLASGGTVSPEQQAIANALKAAPTQRNVFADDPGEGTVKTPADSGGVAPVNTVAPTPQTLNSQGDVSKSIQNFLGGLGTSQVGQAAGSPQSRISVSGAPLGGTFDSSQLQSLLFPTANQAQNAANAQANFNRQGGATFGDVDKIEANENLKLDIEKDQLEKQRLNQQLSEQVRRGVIPGAAKVRNRLGQPLIDLAAIGLTQQQTETSRGIPTLIQPRGMPGGTLFNTRSTIIGR